MRPGSTAVVVDEWPLVRLGIVQALRTAGVRVLAETSSSEEALRRVHNDGATFLLAGAVRDASLADVVRRAVARADGVFVLVLLDHVGRDELAAVVAAGATGFLSRSGTLDEVVDALGRVERGERVVAPALLPLVVGILGAGQADADEAGEAEGVLTRKEREVLVRLAQGLSNREIAEALFVTPATVKTHLAHIYTKLGVAGRQEAITKAVTTGLLG